MSTQNQPPSNTSTTSEITTTTEFDSFGNKIITTRGGGRSGFINQAPSSVPIETKKSNAVNSSGFADDGNGGLGYNPDGTPWGLR